MAKSITEQDIQKSILDYLRIKKYVVFKHNSTQFGIRDGKGFAFSRGEKGIPDIVGFSPEGTFIAVEVKKPGGKPSPEQVEFLERVQQTKMGIGILAYSLEDVMEKVG